MEDWLTINEVANILGVTRMTIYRYMRDGKLSYYKRGSRSSKNPVKFKREDIEQYIKSNKKN